jgi:hypothetical protein
MWQLHQRQIALLPFAHHYPHTSRMYTPRPTLVCSRFAATVRLKDALEDLAFCLHPDEAALKEVAAAQAPRADDEACDKTFFMLEPLRCEANTTTASAIVYWGERAIEVERARVAMRMRGRAKPKLTPVDLEWLHNDWFAPMCRLLDRIEQALPACPAQTRREVARVRAEIARLRVDIPKMWASLLALA